MIFLCTKCADDDAVFRGQGGRYYKSISKTKETLYSRLVKAKLFMYILRVLPSFKMCDLWNIECCDQMENVVYESTETSTYFWLH